jgi:hypothetical protein
LGQGTKPNPPEDFLIITTISLPFTALYAAAAVGITQAIVQRQWPEIDDRTWTGAAVAAGLGALTIAAVSVQWGGGKASTKAEDGRRKVEKP